MDQLFTTEITPTEVDETPDAPEAPSLPWASARVGCDPTAIILADANGEVVGRLQITNAKNFNDRRLTSILRDVLDGAAK